MKFINPKTNYAFKKIFGSNQSQDILISFLNAILYEGEKNIISLEIIDPYSPDKVSELKTTGFEVKAQLNRGETILIQLEAFNTPDLGKRLLYNTTIMYINQLQFGEFCLELRPAIGIAVTDSILFAEHSQVICQFTLKEENSLVDYKDGSLTLVTVELPKFHKSLEESSNITDQWLYFLQKAPDLEVIPDSMSMIPEIKKAFTIADRANLTLAELEHWEKQA